ncbi:MAG: hypothetical protein HOE80_02670, partial [Candidatus Magasanikbacteria bacterium]|nr:hypothetical protein [Candidatus Magasanikbacteria bacterium]
MKKYKYIGVLAFVLCCFFPVLGQATTTTPATAAKANVVAPKTTGATVANVCECEVENTRTNQKSSFTFYLALEKNLLVELRNKNFATSSTTESFLNKKITKDSCKSFSGKTYNVEYKIGLNIPFLGIKQTVITSPYKLTCDLKATTAASNSTYDGPKTVKLDNPLATDCPEGKVCKDLSIPELTGKIVRYLLGIIGAVVFVVFFIGGFFWMTSAGNPEKVKKGSSTMLYAVIGLFVI